MHDTDPILDRLHASIRAAEDALSALDERAAAADILADAAAEREAWEAWALDAAELARRLCAARSGCAA